MSDLRLHFELPASNVALCFCPVGAETAAPVSELIKLSAEDVHTATNEKRSTQTLTHTHTYTVTPTHLHRELPSACAE